MPDLTPYTPIHPRPLPPEAEPREDAREEREPGCAVCADPVSVCGALGFDGWCLGCEEEDRAEQEANAGSRWSEG